MDVTTALLDSWDRQARIVKALADRIDDSNRHFKPSLDGWTIEYHLAHIHHVRRYWLSELDEPAALALEMALKDGWKELIVDLDAIKGMLDISAAAVRKGVLVALEAGMENVGAYDNPVLYLQHMIWHEGWHVGLIVLALRMGGQEPPEAWDEANVWGQWRTEEG